MATILLVEDDMTLAETLSYNLEREGYSVIVAHDGIQALENARRESPDMVILDVTTSGRLFCMQNSTSRE